MTTNPMILLVQIETLQVCLESLLTKSLQIHF
jgi:hypothetical protein